MGKAAKNILLIILSAIFCLSVIHEPLFAKPKKKKKSKGFDSAFEDLEKDRTEKRTPTALDDFIKEAIDNMNISLKGRFIYYKDEVPTTTRIEKEFKDRNNPVFEEKLSYKTQIKRGNHFLATSGWLELGTQEDTYYGVTNSVDEERRERRIHEINELYYVYKFNKADYTAGKKILRNGVSPIISPADRLSPTDWNDPFDPRTLGVIYTSLDLYSDYGSITGAVLPFFAPSKYPSPRSRWTPPSDREVTDRGALKKYAGDSSFTSEYPKISDTKNIQYFLKLQSSEVRGWDIYLSFFKGTSYFAPLRIDTRPISAEEAAANAADCVGSECKVRDDEPATRMYHIYEYIQVLNTAGGFSTTQGIFEIHAEALYQYSERGPNYLGETVQKDDDYINYLGGMTINFSDWTRHIFLNQFRYIIEYTDEYVTKRIEDRTNYISSIELRKRFYGIINMVMFEFPKYVSMRYMFIYQPKDKGWFHDASMKIDLIDRLYLNFKYQFFRGHEDSFYMKNWGHNDRGIFEIVYTFEAEKDKK